MKKLLTIAVCASAVAALAVDTEITVGQVGVTAINSSLANTVVATSYTDLGSDGNIVVSNIVKTANLTTGDKLYVFTSRNNYDGYTLKESGGVKYWDKDLNITIDAAGNESTTASTTPSLAQLAVGKGFWLKRSSTSEPFYIYGKPAAASTTSLTSGSIALIGNPTQDNKAPTVTNPTNGDRIMVPSDASTGLTIYTYNSTNAKWWYRSGKMRVLLDNPPTITAGTGFWYDPKGAAQVSW